MHWFKRMAAACVALVAAAAGAADKPVVGEYLEARNADVWTGPCFANGEMGVVGNRAVMAWKITSGKVNGTPLEGLAVVAVAQGNQTYGMGEPVASRSVIIVDRRANAAQRAALLHVAKTLAAKTLGEIVAVREETIDLQIGTCDSTGCACLHAESVRIETRCLGRSDSICGHERLFYPALAKLQSSRGAYTLVHRYSGADLDATFRDDNARSAVLGTFSMAAP